MKESLAVNCKKRVLAVLACLLMVMMVLFSPILAMAETTSTAAYSQAVQSELSSTYSETLYPTSGGGSYKANELLPTTSGSNVAVIDEVKFNELTSKGQSLFLSDLNKAATTVVSNDTTSTYSYESQTNWYKVLQQQNGVGSKFMNVILENTKPDFVTANAIYKPFSGIVGTTLGLAAVLIMAFLGVVMACDIAYITLPPFRLLVSDDDKGGGIVKSKLITHDAIYAVRKVEEDSDSNGAPKQALGIYLKRRIFALILLGICLMYLIQGQLYTLVGYILDLVSGFLGF